MRILGSYMPQKGYTYGYHIPHIFKEKRPLRASTVVVNNCQHHYHSSDVDNTCICQFCLTSHSTTIMGHACLIEILYICCIFCFLAGVPQAMVISEMVQGVVNSKIHAGMSLSLRTIQKRNYNVFRLYSPSQTSHIREKLLTLENHTAEYDIN